MMSCRQSSRKVKLTSKFEEFSSSKLSSIQRLAHPTPPQNASQPQQQQSHHQQQQQQQQAPQQQTAAAAEATPIKSERNSHKAEREAAKAAAAAAAAAAAPPPANEPPQPTYGHTTPMPKLTANGKIRGRPRKCWQKAETVVKPMSSTREELIRLREENANLKSQLERTTTEFEELKRQSSYTGQTVPKVDYDDLKERYQRDITHAKRNEWCVLCLNPSRYYCCWNTTYCSQKCQVSDWYARHGRSCERRRALKTVS